MTDSETAGTKPDRVRRLLEFLAEERQVATSIEMAEMLWVAIHMEPVAEFCPAEPQLLPPPLPSMPIEEMKAPDLPPPLPFAAQTKVDIAVPIPQAGVLPPQTLPVWLADPAMLTDALGMMRALKPLLQKVDAGLGHRLDEPATADYIARTRLCLPILEPDTEPWFDIVLVVDRSASMHIWQRLVQDAVKILRHYGAFRDVQVFDLSVSKSSDAQEVVQLIANPHRPGHRPSELIDQRGRRIVILLSDCAGPYWWNGTLLPMLQDWGKVMPTAIWQMLPPWMWNRTALGRGMNVAINNDIPGVANQQLRIPLLDLDEHEDSSQRIAMPVITTEVRDLTRWSLMLAGDRRVTMPGILLPKQGGTVPRSKPIEEMARDRAQQALDAGDETDPNRAYDQALDAIVHDRVDRFLDFASPQAKRLITLLAAAPVITMPVVRLIQDSMLYDVQSPLAIAEVFLSSLLQRLPGQGDSDLEQMLHEELGRSQTTQDPSDLAQTEVDEQDWTQWDKQDLTQYDFIVKVRKLLLAKLPAADTLEVINRVSEAVERRWNRVSDQDFLAFLKDPNVKVPETLKGLRSFASIAADILDQLGDESYSSFAQELRRGSGEVPPEGPDENGIDDFPLDDFDCESAQLLHFPPLQPCDYESPIVTAILDRFDFETATIVQPNRFLGLRRNWVIRRRRGVAWGYTEPLIAETGEEIGLDLVAIPSGSFMMGAPENEPDSEDNERPQHEVTLQPFYLGRYAVTQAQWRIVAGYQRIGRDLNPDPSHFKGDRLPVENIDWDDAQEFCQRLSATTGKAYRLPSESQWEYACRAGTETPFYFGATLSPELANYNGNYTYNNGPKGEYKERTTDLGSYPANDWGLYDMHGNVWEWCEDDWHDDYQGAPADACAWVASDRSQTRRVVRGGSWYFLPRDCRSACRLYYSRVYRDNFLGFRVCCVPPRLLLSP